MRVSPTHAPLLLHPPPRRSAFIDFVVNSTGLDKKYPGVPVVCAVGGGGIRCVGGMDGGME